MQMEFLGHLQMIVICRNPYQYNLIIRLILCHTFLDWNYTETLKPCSILMHLVHDIIQDMVTVSLLNFQLDIIICFLYHLFITINYGYLFRPDKNHRL